MSRTCGGRRRVSQGTTTQSQFCECKRAFPTVILLGMKNRLFFDLTAKPPLVSIHYCESAEVEEALEDLRNHNIAVLEIEGATLASQEDLFKAFATALRKPKGWYGDEEYAPNVDAFLEYLDDVVEWVPANGHVVIIRHSEQFWSKSARLAGELVEWWQFSITGHQGTGHLVFAW